MASTPKKPPGASTSNPPSTARKNPPVSNSTTSNGAPPNRSPSRMAAQSASTTSAATNSVNRAKSVRSNTPLSARSAVRTPGASDADDAKAELQAKLDELQERLAQAEQAYHDSQRQASILQSKLDEAVKEQAMLEENVHEHTERIDELENEKKESLRARRELEQIYEAERVAAMKEREEASSREEELQSAMHRLRDTLTHRELRDRTGIDDDRRHSLSRRSSTRSNDPSPNPEARADRQFAPPSSLQRSDSRSSSRLVLQKDKIIEGLRLELAEAQIKLVELENKGGGTMHQLEKDMYDIKMQNARLMEENESFQLLLSEKTLNGDFATSDLLRAPSRSTAPPDSRPQSRDPPRLRASLAEELADNESVEGEGGDMSAIERKLQSEVSSAREQNKALTLYINNIISRLLQHEQFEAILDKTPDLMAGPGAASMKYANTQAGAEEKNLPPPPSQMTEDGSDQPMGMGLLQRAGSVLRGRGKPTRPTSQIQPIVPEQRPDTLSPSAEPRLHEHPDTAPSIPLGRSTSVRNSTGPGHRRANSDWATANLVTNMYKGPSPGLQGPASPGLTSPNSSARGFFTNRIPSTGSVPIAEESLDNNNNKENHLPPSQTQTQLSSSFEPRSRSNRNSTTSNPAGAASHDRLEFSPPRSRGNSRDPTASSTTSDVHSLSNPSSPPRSEVSSSGDSRPSGAIMMGSKPRPLRLVQEAQDDEKARKAANRGSWFGWMNKTGAGAGAGAGGVGGTPTGTLTGGIVNPFANVGGQMAAFIPGRGSVSAESGVVPTTSGTGSGAGAGAAQGQGQ